MCTKKYIAPGGWFSLDYPESWGEFEDEEGSFLFYNPEKWSGNFRISVFKDASASYAKQIMAEELKQVPQATLAKVGAWECVYSTESFVEEGERYQTHLWLMGCGGTVAECSFTTVQDDSDAVAREIIASLELRDENKRYPKEYIPIRVLEINEVNESFEWATTQIKKLIKKDFNSLEKDIPTLQRMVDGDWYKPAQKEVWNAYGIAFATILINEMDGMEWITVIDGKKEYPALRFRQTALVFNPQTWIYEKLKKGEKCNLQQEYVQIKAAVEAVL